MYLIVSLLFCLIIPPSSQNSDEKIKLGVILEGRDKLLPSILEKSFDMINGDRMQGLWPKIHYVIENADLYDSFTAAERVCKMLEVDNVAGIIGPETAQVSYYLDSLCAKFWVPLVKAVEDFKLSTDGTGAKPSLMSVNVAAHPKSVGVAIADFIRDRAWLREYTIVYENETSLFRLQDTLQVEGARVMTHQLDPSGDYRTLLKYLQINGSTSIIIDCSVEKTIEFLKQADDVKMLNVQRDYLITNLDFYATKFEYLKGKTVNVTIMQLVNTRHADFARFVEEVHKLDPHMKEIIPSGVKTEHALFYDAILVYTNAIRTLIQDKSYGLHQPSFSCTAGKRIPVQGSNIFNALKNVSLDGLTGTIKFGEDGTRTDFGISILKFQNDSFIAISEWNEQTGLHNILSEYEMQKQTESSLINQTITVTAIKTEPFLMTKKDAHLYEGKEKYEGFIIDLMDAMAARQEFFYELHEVVDKKYGDNKTDGKWNGVIGELLRLEADVAIGDLTMTQIRQDVVDFTIPFMHLGIGILFKKNAKAETSLFSFLDPFMAEVWIYMGTAYLGVSIVLFILARISPDEWTSSHPCDAEPEELENQFNLLNCMWFAIGSLMQQGCDFLPKAISTRMVASVWWFFTLIMISSYTANLAAFLTSSRMETPIKSAEDLAKQTKIKYGCYGGGSTENFFKNSNSALYQTMWKAMEETEPSVFVGSNEEGIDRVKKGNYAYFMEDIMMLYRIQRDCELVQVGSKLDNKGYGIATRKGSLWMRKMNKGVLDLQETGVILKLKTKWWERPPEHGSCDDESDKSDPMADAKLGIENVGGVFVLLIVGVVIACFVGVFEFLWTMQKNALEKNIPLKEEIKKEMKFIMQCSVSTKPVSKEGSEEGDDLGPEPEPIQKF